jgi:peroxiredoxin
MTAQDDLTAAAESEWLQKWTTGPNEPLGAVLPPGSEAPNFVARDDAGTHAELEDFWADGPALVMFWRHFGCGCGIERAKRLVAEVDDYREAGLNPVIIAQGEPTRAAAYREKYAIPCPILCDPDHVAYRAFGIGQWAVEQVLFDIGPEWWSHTLEFGTQFQDQRRNQDQPMVDDPWRATAEFVIAQDGVIRLAYAYQYCEDYPDPRVLTTAAHLTR